MKFFQAFGDAIFVPNLRFLENGVPPCLGPQAPIYWDLEPARLDTGGGGHVYICFGRARLGLQRVLNYPIGVSHGLGTFLCVFACMCILGAVCGPDWRYYSEKHMAAWTLIFSHIVYIPPCMEPKHITQCTRTMAALYTPQDECQSEATGTVAPVGVSANLKSERVLV